MGSSTPRHEPIPLWLDCDPGHDDAFAILLAAYHPSLKLLGISTCFGNASLTRTTQNALSVLEAIGRAAIPVFPGASRPFCRESKAAPDIHGESGLDGTKLLPVPTRSALANCNAMLEMKDALLACPPGTAWLVSTGTLTNTALLFATFPEVVSHIRGLSVMGGAIGNGFTSVSMGPSFKDTAGQEQPRIGNVTPFAEFNIHCDPEAAQAVFSNPLLSSKTVLIPLDLTHQAYATHSVQKKLLHGQRGHGMQTTRLRQMFHELLTYFEHTYAKVFGLTEGPPLHDPLAIAVILSHACGETQIRFDDHGGERWKVEIELTPEQLGRTKITPASEGVIVPRSLDLHHFWDMVNDCLERADTALCFDQTW